MLISFINFLVCFILFLLSVLIIGTIKGKKSYKSKEDVLFIEKFILIIIITVFYSLVFLYEILDGDEDESDSSEDDEKQKNKNSIFFIIKIYSFNIYIPSLFLNNFSSSIELYRTYINPAYYFNLILDKNKRSSFCEISTLFTIIIIFLSSINLFNVNILYYKFSKYYIFNLDEYENDKCNSPFIIINMITCLLGFTTNFITFIILIILKHRLRCLCFKTRNKLFMILNTKILLSFFYILFVLFNILIKYFYTFDYLLHDNKNLFFTISSFFFLFVYSLDIFLEFIILSKSKFTQYKLKSSLINSIGKFFSKKKNNSEIENLLVPNVQNLAKTYSRNTLDNYYSGTLNNTSLYDDESEISIVPQSSEDIELVLILKNNLTIEDYYFNYIDFIINLVLSSLYKIYSSNVFSPRLFKNKQLSHEMNITESTIFGATNQNLSSTSNIWNQSFDQNSNNSTSFEFIKNRRKNDFSQMDEIFYASKEEKTIFDNIKIKIDSYFTDKCIMNIIDKNLTVKLITNSLKSHLSFSNMKKNDFQNDKYLSIISSNAKEEYFKNLSNLSIKTYDRQLSLDIYETNDKEISLNIQNKNRNIANILDKYFNYIKARGFTGTFLPYLLGIFKVKINNFNTMLIYVSCNSFVENVPRNTFTYWQMIRFSNDQIKKIASSKYQKNLIKDDLIFDESLKKNNKIEIKNYFGFQEVIKHDITFLQSSGCSYSDLIMIYFEYENTQKHEKNEKNEKNGAITIKKTDDDKAELINCQMPILPKDYIEESSSSKKMEDSEIANINISSERNSSPLNNENKLSMSKTFSDNINKNINIDKSAYISTTNDVKIKENDSNIIKNNDNKNNFNNSKLNDNNTNEDLSINDFSNLDDLSVVGRINTINMHNMLDYKERINLNNYEGLFDSFNCLCFFSFENVFQMGKSNKNTTKKYDALQKKILKKFSKKKEN